jgi:hypothetical protein
MFAVLVTRSEKQESGLQQRMNSCEGKYFLMSRDHPCYYLSPKTQSCSDAWKGLADNRRFSAVLICRLQR